MGVYILVAGVLVQHELGESFRANFYEGFVHQKRTQKGVWF